MSSAAAEETLNRLPEWYVLVGTRQSCRRSGPIKSARPQGGAFGDSGEASRKGCTNRIGNKASLKKIPR